MKFILLLLLCSSSFVLANELKLHSKCQNKPIRIAYYDIGNLFYTMDGKFYGYDFDVVSELLKRLDCKSSQLVLKRARIWNELLHGGKLDMTTSGIPTPERLEKLWFIPYIQLRHKVFLNTLNGKTVSFDEFHANSFLKIGKVNGYVHSHFYDGIITKLEKEGRVITVVDDERLFKLLDSQGINAAISYPLVYSRYKNDKNLRGKIVTSNWSTNEEFVTAGLMLSKKYFTKMDAIKIQKIIHDLKNEGLLEKYLIKYLPQKEVDQVLNFQPHKI